MWKVKTILNPRDFSEPSAEAHQMACEIARQCEAKIIFLHVTDKNVVSYIERASELPPKELQEKLWETLRWPREIEAGLEVEHRVVEGEPVSQILNAANQTGCDLIVMGTHGRSGFSRWFTSSVTEQVVFKAPCSVIVAKSRVIATEPSNDAVEEQSVGPVVERLGTLRTTLPA
ncbi:MAG TPA: universal stress protein [Tepidisphaeraceae bacterium]|nr:universal stress protein [Tepidisphaeraceae bacterium]